MPDEVSTRAVRRDGGRNGLVTDLTRVARELARTHARVERSKMKEIWLFPDEEEREIRLVEVETVAPHHEGEIPAYRFPPDPKSRIPFWVAIAVIRPEDKERLEPPAGWGDWSGARKIWPEGPQRIRRIAR